MRLFRRFNKYIIFVKNFCLTSAVKKKIEFRNIVKKKKREREKCIPARITIL